MIMNTREIAQRILDRLSEENLHRFITMFGGLNGIEEPKKQAYQGKTPLSCEEGNGFDNSVSEIMEMLLRF